MLRGATWQYTQRLSARNPSQLPIQRGLLLQRILDPCLPDIHTAYVWLFAKGYWRC